MGTKIEIYVHGSKESAYSKASAAGLTGEALKMACYLGYEHKLTYDVNPENGSGFLTHVDDRPLGGEKFIVEETKIDDGGPAFPCHCYSSNPAVAEQMKKREGMSLRDWLAGLAMQGMASTYLHSQIRKVATDGLDSLQCCADECGVEPDGVVADVAYRLADAMLAERRKV